DLLVHGADDAGMPMARVQDADAAREVEILLAAGVPDARSFGPRDEDRVRVGQAAGDVSLARGDRRVRIRFGDRHRSASICMVFHRASTCERSVASAPIDTRAIQRPSRMAGVRYAP